MRSNGRAMMVDAIGIASALMLGACALATFDGDGYVTTCSFAGRADNACGRCIAANCQPLVDACCASESCRDVPDDSIFSIGDRPSALTRLDACAQGGSCKELEADPGVLDLATCIQTSCPSVCDLWQRSTLVPDASSCEVAPATKYNEATCSCTIPAKTEGAPRTPNAVTCDQTTVHGVCCASKDWPAPASTCECRAVTCVVSGDTCRCEKGRSSSSVNACARGTCCISAFSGTCTCDSYCRPEDTIVEQCTAASVHCGDGRRTVESCSAN